MGNDSEIENELCALEERLLDPAVRGAPDVVGELLADDFVEFGASGRTYSKASVVAALREDPGFDGPRTICDFVIRRLSPGVALATYRIQETGTLRSSVWQRQGGRWRMVFHQGTRPAR